jgi:DNA polymerase-3 subunit delta'
MNHIYSWQKEVWRRLAQLQGRTFEQRGNAFSASSTSQVHALLLKGRKGLGKLAFANFLAKSRLCENPSIEGEPCENCASCRWFEQGTHPDFRLVEPEALSGEASAVTGTSDDSWSDSGANAEAEAETAGVAGVGAGTETGGAKSRKKPSKQISVGQIRDLADFINISSHQNGYRIILVHPAETMNAAAANALLKNLEEPPGQTLFILVAHQAQHLLPTIRSRCLQIAMPAPTPLVASGWLKQQGIKNAETCLASAGYAPLAALELNDNAYLEQHNAFVKHISDATNFNPVFLADAMQKSDLPTVVNWMQKWCYDLLSFRTAGKIRYHVDRFSAIQPLALGINLRSLITYLRTLTKTQQLASHPLNPRLFLEEMLFSYAAVLPDAVRRNSDSTG